MPKADPHEEYRRVAALMVAELTLKQLHESVIHALVEQYEADHSLYLEDKENYDYDKATEGEDS